MTDLAPVVVPRAGIVYTPTDTPRCGVMGDTFVGGAHYCDRDAEHPENYHYDAYCGRPWPTDGFLERTGYPYTSRQQREAAAEQFNKEVHTS